ncbi:MAG: protein kinase [Gammaproteobacteria bacterium]|nr:protein kinase [Gammaproteobacteria bacterium]MCW5582596.1 protein kinase [Gammaproteobacteria bacterium]
MDVRTGKETPQVQAAADDTAVPFVHPKVDIGDLQDNGKLYSDEEIKNFKHHAKVNTIDSSRNPVVRFQKNQLGENQKYPITVVDGEMYAIYKGVKQKKALGRGSFGKTKLMQNLETGEWVVLKVIKVNDLKYFQDKLASARQEERNLTNLHNNTQIKMYEREYLDSNDNTQIQFEIIMPLAHGATVEAIAKNRKMPTINWLMMCKSIIAASQRVIDAKMLHRDYKGENMLYDPVTNITTPIDLGLAIEEDQANRHTRPCGTPDFMAPEIEYPPDGKCIYSEATEVYSLGITLAETLGIKIERNFELIHLSETKEFKEKIQDKDARKEIIELLHKMIDNNPEKRPKLSKCATLIQAIQQKFSTSHLHVISKINQLAYVDISTLGNMLDEHGQVRKEYEKQFQEMMKALKAADVIQLIANDFSKEKVQARNVKHALLREGLQVMESIVLANQADKRIVILNDNARALEKKDDRIYHAFYMKEPPTTPIPTSSNGPSIPEIIVDFENPKKTNAYREEMQNRIIISPDRISKVREKIDGQLSKIKDDRRKEQIQIFLKNLADGNTPLDYNTLLNKLKELETSLLQGRNKGFAQFFERTFGARITTSTKLVKEIETELKQDLGRHRRR